MPVEIREIVIQARVPEDADQPDAPAAIDIEAIRTAILDECAEMIRKALERLGER